MSHFLIFLVGVFSALFFDLLPVVKNAGLIFELQRGSFRAMQDINLTDEQKQKILLVYSGKILLVTLKLLFLFCIILMPFAGLVALSKFFTTTNIESQLVSLTGISLSTLSFLFYFLLKKIYGKFRI